MPDKKKKSRERAVEMMRQRAANNGLKNQAQRDAWNSGFKGTQPTRPSQNNQNTQPSNSSTPSQNSPQTPQRSPQRQGSNGPTLTQVRERRNLVTTKRNEGRGTPSASDQTARRTGRYRTERRQQQSYVNTPQRRVTYDRNKTTVGQRISDTLKGSGKQFIGGKMATVGTAAQFAEPTVRGIQNTDYVEPVNRYSLRSREEAEQREADSLRTIGVKEGRDLRTFKGRDYSGQNKSLQDFIKEADDMIASGSRDIERAKDGAGAIARVAIDMGANASQMVGDMLENSILPGLGIVSLMNRAAGTASYEARQEGMDVNQQMAYAAGTGLIEGLSEGIFNSVTAFHAAYGKGALSLADKINMRGAATNIVQNYLKSDLGRSLALQFSRLGAGMLEEGVEEIVAGLAEPALKYALTHSGDDFSLAGMGRAAISDPKDLAYSFLVGALMGGLGGVTTIAGDVRSDMALSTQAAIDGENYVRNVQDLIARGKVQGREGARKTNSEVLAEQIQGQMDSGKTIQPSQVRMLQRALGESTTANERSFFRRRNEQYEQAVSEGRADTVQPMGTSEERTAFNQGLSETEKRNVEAAKEALGESGQETSTSAVALGKAMTGSANTYEVDTILADPKAREAAEDLLGEKLPVKNAEARTQLENRIAMNEMFNRDEILTEAQRNIRKNMSQRGGAVFDANYDNAVKTIGVRNAAEIYESFFSRLYTDGTIEGSDFNDSYDRIIAPLKEDFGEELGGRIAQVFNREFAQKVFMAGQASLAGARAKSEGIRVARSASEKPADFTYETEARKKISDRQADLLKKFAERANVHIRLVNSIAGGSANGMYDPESGVIMIAADSTNKIITVAKHELTHHIKATSPELYQKLEDFVLKKWYDSDREAMERRVFEYQKKYNGSVELAREELIADASEAFFTDKGAIDDVMSFSQKLGKAIHDGIKTLLDNFLDIQDTDNRKYRGYGDFLKDIDILKEAESMWLEALEEGKTRNRGDSAVESSSKMSLKDAEDSQGNKLTEGQRKFFKNSKVRDDDGNLLVLYHGTDSAGFNTFKVGSMFKGIFFSSSRRTANAYGGNWENKLYDPNERETREPIRVGNYTEDYLQNAFRDMHFDTKEDLEKFKAEHPGIEDIKSEDEINRMLDDEEISEDEYDRLRKLNRDVRMDYASYELEHMGDATWQDILDNPDAYGFNDLVRALTAYDRDIAIDEGYEPDTKEDLLDAMRTILEEDENERGADEKSMRDLPFRARLPVGRDSEYVRKVNNRTYKTYVNLTKPLIVDAHGKHMSDGYYEDLENALADKKYDGFIAKNVRIGKYGDEGYVVVAKNPNQVKLTSNENPTRNEDIRYSRKDSEGNELSKGQQEYFGNSQVKNEDGSLKVMYHGSPNKFTTFDIKKAKPGLYGRGFYFTEDKSRASQYGEPYKVYLDIETPLQTGTHEITKPQLRKFISVLARDEDYGIENYGYGATVDSVLKSVWGKDDYSMLQDLNASAVGDFAEAVQLFNKVNGTSYDGIIAPTETIAFYPEQIKETVNKNPTNDSDIRFSMKEPVEETKDLVAVHNLEATNLESALELGGFPMPSIAIIKASAGHNMYGDFSLIFDKNTIDPSVDKRNVVYGGDAWTPTFPHIAKKINGKAAEKIRDNLISMLGIKSTNELPRGIRFPSLDVDNLADKLDSRTPYEAFKNDDVFRMAYLKDAKNLDLTIPTKEGAINDLDREALEYLDKRLPEFTYDDIYDTVAHTMEFEPLVRAARKDYYNRNGEVAFKSLQRYLEEEMGYNDVLQQLEATLKFRSNGIPQVADVNAFKESIAENVDENGYKEWINNLFEGIVEKKGIRNNKDFFTRSGNRRSWEALHDEPTLLNIARVMAEQENGETLFGSSLKANAQKKYRNISEVKADKGRLKTISEEEYKKLMDSFAERESEIITRIDEASPTYESNPFMRHDEIRSAIVDNVRKGLSKSAFLNDLKKWGNTKGATQKDVDDIFELVKDVANMPTGYFEAKPKRPVTFYEVRALLAPSDADANLITKLQGEGVNVVQYEAGNEEDRIAKLNQAAEETGTKFSLKEDDVLDRYIADRQKRIDDGEQMSFFGSLNETLPSKPKTKTRAEKFYDNVLKTIANIQKKGTWSGLEVKGLFLQYPEFNFIERLNNKSDDTAEADFKAFVSSFDKTDDLRLYNHYFSAYEWNSEWKKRNRSGKTKFNKLIENRIEEIMAGKAHGRNVGIEKRDYTPKEMRKLFNELNTDKELKELGKRVFDCIDKNFDVRFQGVANIDGFKHGQGGTLGQAGGRTVHLNMKYLNSEGYTDQQKASTILHESIHTVTVYALRNRNNYTMPKSIQDACDVIEDVFWQIKNDPSFKDEYGVSKGAEEMVAELANPTFRAKLKAKNVFARVIEAIRNILGINVEVGGKANAFKEVNSALETLMSNADVVSFERYASRVSRDYNGKFSLKDLDNDTSTTASQNTITKLEEKVKDLKAEFKRTNLKTADQKQTRIQAGRLIARHGSNMQVQTNLVNTFNDIFKLYKEKGTDAFDEVYEMAKDAAVDVVNNISLIHDEGAEEYKAIKQYLRETSIEISDDMKRNITDYNDFRKRYFGKLKLVNGETSNIDNVYMELMELFPEQFTDEYTNPADQLYHIVDVLDNFAPYYETLDGASPEMQDYVVEIASDIMETAYNLQTKKTFADKKYEEKVRAVKKAREKALASRNKALDRQKQRYERKLDDLKQKNKDYKAKVKENAEKKRRIMQISNIYKRMREKLQEATDTKHLPDGYAPIVSDVLARFDFTTEGMEKWAERHGRDSKKKNLLNNLQKELRAMAEKEGGEIEVDADLLPIVEDLTDILGDDEVRLSDLNSDELTKIKQLFAAFEHQINSYNKLFVEGQKQTTQESAYRAFEEMKEDNKWKFGIMGRTFAGNFNPSDFFTLVGGEIGKLYDNTRKGFDRYVQNMDDAREFIQDIVTNKKADQWANNVRTYKTSSGEEIKLTDTQLMDLYVSSRREQAQGHIYYGGIISAPVKVKAKKKLKAEELDEKRIIPTQEDVASWFSELSKEQIKVAEAMQKYLTDKPSAWGNETSMAMYGYRKFNEAIYWPIQSSTDYMDSNFDMKGTDPTLKNIGPSKAVTKGANNAIVIDDIFSVFCKHVAQMASYNAYVPAISDFQRVWNYSEGNNEDKVKARFKAAYGKEAYNYVEDFFKSLNGSYKNNFDADFGLLDKGMGLFKKAAVGGNIRVLVQQPTAIARAALLINPAYLTASIPSTTAQAKKTYQEMMEHCPIAKWKAWGFYSTDVTSASRDLKNIMIGKDALTDKIFMNMYGIADNMTWTVIFNACKMQVEAQNKGLKKGSDEYWEKVNDLASEVFDRTQVVDSPFHRSNIMKSQDTGKKMLTAFMAEPTKTVNMLNTEITLAARELKAGHPGKAAAIFTRVGMVFTANAALLAVAQAAVDAMRHTGGDDDKDKGKYGDRWVAYWKENFKENLAIVGMIPILKDVQSIWEGYDVTRMDMQGVKRVVQSIQYLKKYVENPSESKYTGIEEISNVIFAITYAAGIPISNVRRDLEAAALTGAEATNNPDVALWFMKNKYQVNSKTKSLWISSYFNALENGNQGLANNIKRYITSNGVITEDDIQKAANKRRKDNPTEEDQARIEKTMKTLEGSNIWQTSSDEDKDKYGGYLEKIALEIEDTQTNSITKYATDGLTNEQIVLFKLALRKADKPNKHGNLGTFDKDEKEAALQMLMRNYKFTQKQKEILLSIPS